MTVARFNDREDAGRQLAERLRRIPLNHPLVLAIPRGGLEVGAPLARALGAELDVVLSRKLHAPGEPELAIGAVAESGEVYIDPFASAVVEVDAAYLERERRRETAEIEHRTRVFRAVRPRASVAGRSVIVTDDGIATGSTMIAALRAVRGGGATETIVAVPVAASDRLAAIGGLCDRIVCLHEPVALRAIGQFYRDFRQVSDERAVALLDERWRQTQANRPDAATPSS